MKTSTNGRIRLGLAAALMALLSVTLFTGTASAADGELIIRQGSSMTLGLTTIIDPLDCVVPGTYSNHGNWTGTLDCNGRTNPLTSGCYYVRIQGSDTITNLDGTGADPRPGTAGDAKQVLNSVKVTVTCQTLVCAFYLNGGPYTMTSTNWLPDIATPNEHYWAGTFTINQAVGAWAFGNSTECPTSQLKSQILAQLGASPTATAFTATWNKCLETTHAGSFCP